MLDFQVEVVKIEEPLPDGYQFAWTDDAKVPKSEKEAFNLIDEDNDGAVDLPEVCAFFSPCQKKSRNCPIHVRFCQTSWFSDCGKSVDVFV